MEFSCTRLNLEILSLDNTNGVRGTVTVPSISLQLKKHTLASIKVTQGMAMAFRHFRQEKFIAVSSKMAIMKDMDSSSMRKATSMTDSGLKAIAQVRDFSHKVLVERFKSPNGWMTN
jgi:hypothetical protein